MLGSPTRLGLVADSRDDDGAVDLRSGFEVVVLRSVALEGLFKGDDSPVSLLPLLLLLEVVRLEVSSGDLAAPLGRVSKEGSLLAAGRALGRGCCCVVEEEEEEEERRERMA